MAIHGKQLRDATINLEKLQGIPAGLAADKLLLSGNNGAFVAPDYDSGADIEFTVSGQTLSVDVKKDAIGMTELDAAIIASTLGSNHSTLPTSQAVRDYVDAQDLDLATDSGTTAVDLNSQTLTIAGGTGIDSSATGQTVTLAIDSTVATKTYADTKLPLAGGTMSGNIAMGTYSITGMANPTSAQDAATKAYVDAQVSASGNGLNFAGDTGTDSVVFSSGTLTFAGGSNLSTTVTNDQVEIALDPHISLTSATLSSHLLVGGDAVITGNLTVNGTTTTVNTTELAVEDINIELASGNTLDATADGGGITLKGATDKTFSWVDLTDSWTSSEHMDLASSKSYHIAGTELLATDGVKKISQDALHGFNADDSYLEFSSQGMRVAIAPLLEDAAGQLDGNGLVVANTYQLRLDLNELVTATVDVATDSIAIVDADDNNSTKKELIVDLVAAMAGDGISATSGVLATTRDIELITGISGTQPTIKTLSTDNIATNLIDLIELRVNGISYPQGGSSTDKEWYIDTNTRDLKWNDNSFSLETTDEIELVTYS